MGNITEVKRSNVRRGMRNWLNTILEIEFRDGVVHLLEQCVEQLHRYLREFLRDPKYARLTKRAVQYGIDVDEDKIKARIVRVTQHAGALLHTFHKAYQNRLIVKSGGYRDLESLVAAGSYDFVREFDGATLKEVRHSGIWDLSKDPGEVLLVSFREMVETGEALYHLAILGLVPVDLYTLLEIGRQFPEECRDGKIVAFGSDWTPRGGFRSWPIIYGDHEDNRGLLWESEWPQERWSTRTRFAARLMSHLQYL